MRFFLLALLLFVSLKAFAQDDFRNGYVILINGDSINGEVLYRNSRKNAISCEFQSKSSKETVTYLPSQIAAYGYILDKRFESRALPEDSVSTSRVFAEVMVKGYMSLLKFNNILYVESPDGKIHILPRPLSKLVETDKGKRMLEQSPHIGVLNWLLSDCALDAKAVSYDENSISRLVQRYNHCHGQPGIYYKEQRKATLLTFQVFGGIQASQLISISSGKSLARSVLPTGGISLEFSSPRVFDRIFFSAEVLYSKQFFSYYEKTYVGNIITEHHDVTVDQTIIKVPMGVRYNFLNDNRTFYVKAGGVLGLASKQNVDETLEIESSTEVRTYLFSQQIKGDKVGMFGSLGFTQVMAGKLKGFVELRYETMTPFRPGNIYGGSTGFYLITGIRF